MFDSLSEDLKKLLLAGVGAAALSAEKGEALVQELVKKGSLTVEQGKQVNAELKHNLKERKVDALKKQLNELSPEELTEIKAGISELEKE